MRLAAIGPAYRVNLTLFFELKIRIDPIPLDHIPIQFDAQSRRVGHADVPAFHFEIFNERMRPDIHARNRGPARMGQHRAQMHAPHRSQARSHQLQPERQIRLGGQRALFDHATRAAAYHKPVAHALAHRSHEGRVAEMHGDWAGDLLAQQRVARHIVLRNGRLDHRQLAVLVFQVPNQGRGSIHAQQQGIEIRVDLEIRGRGLRHSLKLFFRIKPRARLDFHRRKSVIHCGPRF